MNWKIVLLALGCFAFIVGALLLSGISPIQAAQTLFNGSVGSAKAFSGTLKETTPLLITGVAVYIALQAGLFNIGAEGQLLVGACAAAATSIRIPGVPGILLGCLFAMAAGALWALPAVMIKVFRGAHEVISTIMLNNIALHLTNTLVEGPLKDPASGSPTTVELAAGSRIPWLIEDKLRINFALVLALVLVVFLAYWFKRTVLGFEVRATGANQVAARYAGINTRKVQIMAMLASGAVSGFAGAIMVLAHEGRFYLNFSPGYGFDGLGVALLAGAQPLSIIPSALLFGFLAKGGVSLSMIGVSRGVSNVILGLLIVLFAAYRYRKVVIHG